MLRAGADKTPDTSRGGLLGSQSPMAANAAPRQLRISCLAECGIVCGFLTVCVRPRQGLPRRLFEGERTLNTRFTCVFASALVVVSAGRVGGEEPRQTVEGDRALLDMLCAAQATGQSSFPRGALTATSHTTNAGGVLDQTIDVVANIVWDGPSTYWKYKQIVLLTGREPEVTEGEMIETKERRFHYWPRRKLAMIASDGLGGYRSNLRLRPDQQWFGMDDGSRRWSEMFDVGTPDRPPKVKFDRLEVRADGDHIIVRRHINGRVLRITASLKYGANVVAYEPTPSADDPMWYRGDYEWGKLPDGRFWLKHHDYELAANGDKSHANKTYELTVTDFNPEPTIAADRFRFESLNVPDGTQIQEVSKAGTKTYRQGQKTPTRQELLDELADGLRRKGFAANSADQEKP